MRNLLREPLVHFLILGAAMVAVSSIWLDRGLPRDDEIIIQAGQIEHLAARFARTWQRPPTLEELEGLVDEHVREEVAYREGIAIGLDRDDTIIRRRVRQKLDFIAVDIGSMLEPSEEDLAAYLAEHPDEFRVEPRFTFVQVYFDPERRGENIESDARRVLDALHATPDLDIRELGDRTLIPTTQEDLSLREITNLFGMDFAAAMAVLAEGSSGPVGGAGRGAGAERGSWLGPFASGYGLHLVRVDRITEAHLPELTEIREVVRREWENARRVVIKEDFYAGLLERYQVTIEWPEAIRRGSAD